MMTVQTSGWIPHWNKKRNMLTPMLFHTHTHVHVMLQITSKLLCSDVTVGNTARHALLGSKLGLSSERYFHGTLARALHTTCSLNDQKRRVMHA